MATALGQPHGEVSMEGNAAAGPSQMRVKMLPYALDLTCPLSLPSRKSADSFPWPYLVSGPVNATDEEPVAFTRRRYLETLCLSDLLASLPSFVMDLLRISLDTDPSDETHPLPQLIRPLLLPLRQIEIKYRQSLLPLVTTLSSSSTAAIKDDVIKQAAESFKWDERELDILRVALELRANSRFMEESNGVVHPKRVLEELERRETLIQVILLLLLISHSSTEEPKKRKRKHDRKSEKTSLDDPNGALELLMDRLGVWHAVADLGIGVPEDMRGKKKEDEGMQAILKRFWDEVLIPFFLPLKPDLCSTFHLKVFGSPIPAKLLPSTTKKPRKPKQTHPKPSTDDLVAESLPAELVQPMPRNGSERSLSRAPSVKLAAVNMRRSVSRTSDSAPPGEGYRRSRSRSVDPAPKESSRGLPNPVKKGLGRAPSGKDLFKGREVGLMMRATSIASRKDKAQEESQTQSQGRGLLGRKTSDLLKRKVSGDGASQTQPKDPNTIIFATPSRPRVSHSAFGRPSAAYHPTPIQEEPSSGERPSWVAETPVHPHRMVEIPLSRLASVEEDESDPLGDLMVPTDDEDEGDDSRDVGIVPETPAR